MEMPSTEPLTSKHLLSFLPPAGNNTGRKTIRISRVAAVGTNSESKRYLKKKETHHSLVKEEKRPIEGPGAGMR